MFQWVTFGKIKFNNVAYAQDIIVDTEGDVLARDRSIPEGLYGTSHEVGEEELQHILDPDTKTFLLGTGHYGVTKVNGEGIAYLKSRKISLKEMPIPEAIKFYNEKMGKKGRKPKITALMHLTC